MNADSKRRFDPESLAAFFGETVFARGKAYYRDNRVRIIGMEPRRVLAQVSGSEDYRVEVTGEGATIGGRCACPAFEDWGPCKHMAATALAVIGGSAVEAGGAAPLDRIREYLRTKGHDALIDLIVDQAERDSALLNRLDVAASALGADDRTLKARLKAAIDRATKTRGFVEYAEARGWSEGVDDAIDSIADLASGPRAGVALDLAWHAIDRIENALNEIDDSNGSCGGLLERAASIHAEAARAAKPDPIALAGSLFGREMESGYDAFSGAAETYAEALGPRGLSEYRRLAREAWERLPALHAGSRRGDDHDRYRRLMDILDRFAARDGDIEARIALRAKDLSSTWAYLSLAEFCRGASREDDALRWAQEGLWAFEDGTPDQRLVDFTSNLLRKAGKTEEAGALVWRAFEKLPSAETYEKLRALVGDAARERAIALLTKRLENARDRFSSAETLVRILIAEKDFDTAWRTARQHASSLTLRMRLAADSCASHPAEALATFAERVDVLVQNGGSPGYAEAATLVRRMASLRSKAEHAAYVADLKARFGRKRNFMNLLA